MDVASFHPELPCVLGAWFSVEEKGQGASLPTSLLAWLPISVPLSLLIPRFCPPPPPQARRLGGRDIRTLFSPFLPSASQRAHPQILRQGAAFLLELGGGLVCPHHRIGEMELQRMELPHSCVLLLGCSVLPGAEGRGVFLWPAVSFPAAASALPRKEQPERAGRALPGASSQDAEEPRRQKAALSRGVNLWQGRVPRFCRTKRFPLSLQFFLWSRAGRKQSQAALAKAWSPPGTAFPLPSSEPPLLSSPLCLGSGWLLSSPLPSLAILEAGLGGFDHILKNALKSVEIPQK